MDSGHFIKTSKAYRESQKVNLESQGVGFESPNHHNDDITKRLDALEQLEKSRAMYLNDAIDGLKQTLTSMAQYPNISMDDLFEQLIKSLSNIQDALENSSSKYQTDIASSPEDKAQESEALPDLFL